MERRSPTLGKQTYDIDFVAPIFDGDKKVKHARITVRHNGVLIHDDVELKTGTGASGDILSLYPEIYRSNIISPKTHILILLKLSNIIKLLNSIYNLLLSF